MIQVLLESGVRISSISTTLSGSSVQSATSVVQTDTENVCGFQNIKVKVSYKKYIDIKLIVY